MTISGHKILNDSQRQFLKTSEFRAFDLPFRGWSEKPHELSHEVVVTLTSYPARFPTLALTLECLLKQSVKPDRVVLWIGQNDKGKLPRNVLALVEPKRKLGFEICFCEDLRSYTKIIPSLERFPKAALVTADDDVYYDKHWLRDLLKGWSGQSNEIVCSRAHGVILQDGLPTAYSDWARKVEGPIRSTALFPTGVGGVLYPAGSLSKEVTDKATFMNLAPTADDVWLYFMGIRAHSVFSKIEQSRTLYTWPGSQDTGLKHENYMTGDGNDAAIGKMIKQFGWPQEIPSWSDVAAVTNPVRAQHGTGNRFSGWSPRT